MFTLATFAAGFVCAAAMAAWKPTAFRRVVTGVVAAAGWARKKFIGDAATETDESD